VSRTNFISFPNFYISIIMADELLDAVPQDETPVTPVSSSFSSEHEDAIR
jgi:hypothetical protein